MRVAIVVLALSGLLSAEMPDAPQPNVVRPARQFYIASLTEEAPARVVDKKYVFTEALLAGTIVFDAYSTVKMHAPCYETNPLLGKHPSSAAVGGLFAGQFVASLGINYFVKKSMKHRRFATAAWMAPSLYLAADHLRGGINNYALGCD